MILFYVVFLYSVIAYRFLDLHKIAYIELIMGEKCIAIVLRHGEDYIDIRLCCKLNTFLFKTHRRLMLGRLYVRRGVQRICCLYMLRKQNVRE